jgi:hypothetical protein
MISHLLNGIPPTDPRQRLGRLDRAGKRVRDVVGVVAFHPGSSSGQSFLVGTYECRKKSHLNTGVRLTAPNVPPSGGRTA